MTQRLTSRYIYVGQWPIFPLFGHLHPHKAEPYLNNSFSYFIDCIHEFHMKKY